MQTIFDSHLLIFTIPIFISCAIWLLALIGMFDFKHFELHIHHDGDWAAHFPHWDNFFVWIGLGLVPASLLITLNFFLFGILGISIYVYFNALLFEKGLTMTLALLSCAIPAFIIGIIASALISRPLSPFFKDYGRVQLPNEFIGKIAHLTSNSLTSTFGTATLKNNAGIPITLDVRTENSLDNAKYGTSLLILEHNPQNNTYLVEEFVEEV